MVAKNRPQAPIIAVTAKETVVRQLQVWGVSSVDSYDSQYRRDDRFMASGADHGYIKEGDLVVITAELPECLTNLIKAQIMEIYWHVLQWGTGTARSVCVERCQRGQTEVQPWPDTVTHTTDKTMIPLWNEQRYHYRRRWTYIPCGRGRPVWAYQW